MQIFESPEAARILQAVFKKNSTNLGMKVSIALDYKRNFKIYKFQFKKN